MSSARPVGIGFLVVAVLAGIGVRVEVGSESASGWLITLYATVGIVAALVGGLLMLVARRADNPRRYRR